MAGVRLNGMIGHLRRVAATTGAAAQTDGELLHAFLAWHDEVAFETLVRRHGPMVLGVCNRILPDGADADDAFQTTFLVLVRKAHAIGRPELLANWLHGVACRTAHKARVTIARRRCRERLLADIDDAALCLAGRGADSENAQGLRPLLDDALSRLPRTYRVPLVLCELEGQSRKQAAQLLGLPEGTLSSRLARGRQLLASLLRRRGVALSAGALTAALAQARADAVLSPLLVCSTARAATAAAAGLTGLSLLCTRIAALSEGVLQAMGTTKAKCILAVVAGFALLAATFLPRPGAAEQPDVVLAAQVKPAQPPKAAPRPRSVIILWMNGGPSQIDTFDLKPGQANGGPFREIDTTVKGIRISEHLPKLARHMEHMVLIRSVAHREGDHARATHLMHTGYTPQAGVAYPTFGAVLAKELGNDKAGVPNYVCIDRFPLGPPPGAGHLGPRHEPLQLAEGAGGLLPDLERFQDITKDHAEAWRKAVAEAIDLSGEKDAVKAAYGNNAFGDHCLIARRLVERRVPVIEITLSGWDTHADNFAAVQKLSGTLDAAWSALMADLKERKLLDTTLIVWLGEFGRTPRINANRGRDHWPMSMTVVLAGGLVRGGQAIGKTNPDGAGVDERPVTVPELMATIYQAAGVDPAKRYKAGRDGPMIPIVDDKAEPVKEALPEKASPKAGAKGSALQQQAERLARLPAELLKLKRTDGEVVDALFAAVLQRPPTETEKKFAAKHISGAKDRKEACCDVIWTLANTDEFLQLHDLPALSEEARRFRDRLTHAWKK